MIPWVLDGIAAGSKKNTQNGCNANIEPEIGIKKEKGLVTLFCRELFAGVIQSAPARNPRIPDPEFLHVPDGSRYSNCSFHLLKNVFSGSAGPYSWHS